MTSRLGVGEGVDDFVTQKSATMNERDVTEQASNICLLQLSPTRKLGF